GRAPAGGVEARPRDAKDPAEVGDRVIGPLRADEAMHRRYLRSVSVAKKAAAFLKISRSSRSFRFSRRSSRSSLRSSVVNPSRLPASTSAWFAQLRRVWSETPRSLAIWPIDSPELLTRRIASARNSGG